MSLGTTLSRVGCIFVLQEKILLNILITGSAGRVGRAIYIRLMKHYRVRGIDVNPASSVDYVGSITDKQFLESIPERFDIIIHCAALHSPHVGIRTHREFVRNNITATKILSRWGHSRDVCKIIFLSSTAVYGYASQCRGKCAWITEETPPQPRTIYHTTKLKAEFWLRRYSQTTGIPVTVLRISRCFPESADKMALYRLHRGIDMRDVATACLKAIEANLPAYQLFNISGATPFHEVDCDRLTGNAAAVIRQRSPALAVEFDARSWTLPDSIDRIYDSTKAQLMLNWNPTHHFQAVLNWLDDEVPEVLPVVSPRTFNGIVEE